MPNWGGGAQGAAGGAATGSAFGPWGTAIGGTLGGLMGLFGGQGATAQVPKDEQALRAQQLQLLTSLLSPGAFSPGGAGSSFFGSGGLDDILKQTSPEMQTYNTAKPILEGMLTGTGPQFERDIASANATGGRFGSGNAIMRGEALRNLFNMRTNVAGTLGTLSNSAGNSQFERMFQAQQQHIQLLTGLLGMGGQATLSAPVTPANNNQLGDLLKLFATIGGNRGGAPSPRTPSTMPSTPTPFSQPWLNG